MLPSGETVPYLVISDKNLEQIDFPDGPPRFIVRMPTPIAALDEWLERHSPKPAEATQPIVEVEGAADESLSERPKQIDEPDATNKEEGHE